MRSALWLVLPGLLSGACSTGGTGTPGGDGGAQPSALVAQCQSLAMNFQTKCAGSAPRPCLWAAYGQLCKTGRTQLLIDSITCLDATTCRTFSDPNQAAQCLAGVHGTGESAAARAFLSDTCSACGQTGCSAPPTGTAEIYPYLTDADLMAVAGCRGSACTLDAIDKACAQISDIAPFAACSP
jgi:hypothetical protein